MSKTADWPYYTFGPTDQGIRLSGVGGLNDTPTPPPPDPVGATGTGGAPVGGGAAGGNKTPPVPPALEGNEFHGIIPPGGEIGTGDITDDTTLTEPPDQGVGVHLPSDDDTRLIVPIDLNVGIEIEWDPAGVVGRGLGYIPIDNSDSKLTIDDYLAEFDLSGADSGDDAAPADLKYFEDVIWPMYDKLHPKDIKQPVPTTPIVKGDLWHQHQPSGQGDNDPCSSKNKISDKVKLPLPSPTGGANNDLYSDHTFDDKMSKDPELDKQWKQVKTEWGLRDAFAGESADDIKNQFKSDTEDPPPPAKPLTPEQKIQQLIQLELQPYHNSDFSVSDELKKVLANLIDNPDDPSIDWSSLPDFLDALANRDGLNLQKKMMTTLLDQRGGGTNKGGVRPPANRTASGGGFPCPDDQDAFNKINQKLGDAYDDTNFFRGLLMADQGGPATEDFKGFEDNLEKTEDKLEKDDDPMDKELNNLLKQIFGDPRAAKREKDNERLFRRLKFQREQMDNLLSGGDVLNDYIKKLLDDLLNGPIPAGDYSGLTVFLKAYNEHASDATWDELMRKATAAIAEWRKKKAQPQPRVDPSQILRDNTMWRSVH